MKIAVNAVRVSKKSGGGLETYIVNLTNTLAKLHSDLYVYTLYPEHFPEVKPERIINPVKVVTQFIRVIASTSEAISTKLSRRERDCHSLPWRPRNDIVGHLVTQENIVPDPPRWNRGKSGDYLGRWKRILPFNGDTLRILWTQLIFPFYLLKRNYDLLFSPTQLDGLFFCPIFQVVTIHDTIPLLFPEYKHKQKVYLKYLLPKILDKAKKIITVSENTEKDVINFYNIPPEKIRVIPYGMKKSNSVFSKEDIDNFKKKNGLDRYILCVSNNFPHKNLLRLIEAFATVKKQQEVKLLIVGYQEKTYQEEINKKIENLKLKDEIKLLGHFPQTELSVVYTGAEVFVFPSVYEGFGLPPLEAMSYGCPVVVSNTGSLPEVVGDAGRYVNPYHPESIAEGIIKVLTNETLRQELIAKGFEQVKKFSWEKAAKETLKVFEEVVRYPEPSG